MTRPWMPLYVGDFIADTMHLGATETGIYMRLILHCWQHGTIPLDDRRLSLIAHCDSRLWHQYKETVLQFFDVVDASTMHHKRVTTELHRAEEISNKRKGAAQQKHIKSSASVVQLHTQSQPQSQPQKKEKKDTGKSLTLLPDVWSVSTDHYELGKKMGLSTEAVGEAAAEMRAWSLGNGEKRRDWDMVFNNWLRRNSRNGPRRSGTLQDDSRSVTKAAERLHERAKLGELTFGPRPGIPDKQSADVIRLLPKGGGE